MTDESGIATTTTTTDRMDYSGIEMTEIRSNFFFYDDDDDETLRKKTKRRLKKQRRKGGKPVTQLEALGRCMDDLAEIRKLMKCLDKDVKQLRESSTASSGDDDSDGGDSEEEEGEEIP